MIKKIFLLSSYLTIVASNNCKQGTTIPTLTPIPTIESYSVNEYPPLTEEPTLLPTPTSTTKDDYPINDYQPLTPTPTPTPTSTSILNDDYPINDYQPLTPTSTSTSTSTPTPTPTPTSTSTSTPTPTSTSTPTPTSTPTSSCSIKIVQFGETADSIARDVCNLSDDATCSSDGFPSVTDVRVFGSGNCPPILKAGDEVQVCCASTLIEDTIALSGTSISNISSTANKHVSSIGLIAGCIVVICLIMASGYYYKKRKNLKNESYNWEREV